MIQFEIKAPIGREYDGNEYTIKCMDPGVTFAVELFTVEPISPWRERAIPYQIPEGSTATLRVTRPDRAYTNTKTTIEGGIIFCPVHPYSVATPGKCSADVAVYGPDGNRITSATFHFFVDRECAPTAGENAPVFVDSIQGLIEFVEQSAERAEAAADRAESSGGGNGGNSPKDGITPHIGANGNWYIGTTDTGVSAEGEDGEDGGHYTPVVTQPTTDTILITFTPSKATMPAVAPVTVQLPAPSESNGTGEHPDNPVVDGITVGGENGVRFDSEGEPSTPVLALYGAQGDEPVRVSHVAPAQEDGEAVPLGQVKQLVKEHSGQNLALDTTLTQSGKAADAKAVGDALAKVGKPSDEQIAGVVAGWLDEHPEATTTVANKSITPGKTDFLEIRTAVGPEELTWVSAGYNMLANDGYLDIRGVDTITVVHRNPNIADVAVALYAEDQSQIQTYTVVSGPENQQNAYDESNVRTTITKLDVSALVGDTAAVFAKVRVQQDPNKEYALAVYLGDIDAPVGYTWAAKYGVPQFPDGGVTLRQTNFMEVYGKNLFDTSRFVNSGYSGALFEQYGSNATVFADYIDVSERKTFYIRARFSASEGQFAKKVGCYDADKNFISSDGSFVTVTKMRMFSDVVLDGVNHISGGNTFVHRYTVDDSVKFVRISGNISAGNAAAVEPRNLNLTISSYEDILDMTSPPEQYWRRISDEWRNTILKATEPAPKTMVMIGDSLTNWGGGGDGSPGFLKVVHDKTGVITSNEGTAGAWWQTGAEQEYCGVNRVNRIISDGRKYDLYCFMLGTNAGSNTDTGETSADPSTMPGAIRYCLEKLKAYDPTTQILVCLPPQRAEGNENQEKVNEVIAKICAEYAVPTLDIYHRGGIVPNTKIADIGYLYDGLHLGEPGYTVLGNLLAAEVKYLLCL